MVLLPDEQLLVVSEKIASLDPAKENVITTPHVEALGLDLQVKWSKEEAELYDSPGRGAVVLQPQTDGDPAGLTGVDSVTGADLWSVSAADLEATGYSGDPAISSRDDVGDTRGLVFGSARDESSDADSAGFGSGDVVLDAKTGKQVYVGTAASSELQTEGYWQDDTFVWLSDGVLAGFSAPDPPVGVLDGRLVFPS
jgi:hypothetical protein